MSSKIHYHPRGADLGTLADLHNARQTRPEYKFDTTQPLRLACEDGHYWMLSGTSLTKFRINAQWVSVHLAGQPERYRKELERCHGIEATCSAEVALDRLIAVERRRAAKKEEEEE